MLITEIIVMTVVFLASFMYVEKHNRFFYISLGLVGILAGLLANPVRLGVKSLEEHPTLKMVDKVVEANGDAVWIFESEPYPLTDILITRGARTINSTNVYPDLERWKKIDPEGRYKEVYNRYAHIILCYGQPPEGEEKFQLLNADYFKAYLDDSDLKKLGVNYLMTRNDLSYDDNFNLIDSTGGFSIYELKADN